MEKLTKNDIIALRWVLFFAVLSVVGFFVMTQVAILVIQWSAFLTVTYLAFFWKKESSMISPSMRFRTVAQKCELIVAVLVVWIAGIDSERVFSFHILDVILTAMSFSFFVFVVWRIFTAGMFSVEDE